MFTGAGERGTGAMECKPPPGGTSTPLQSARGCGPLACAAQAGLVGTPRPKNPLLQRDDVGRARPTCYSLPDDGFAFGRPGNQDMEGAREVSMMWVSHTPSRCPEDCPPDFVLLHRKAVAAKITTSKDLKAYRRDHECMVVPRASPRFGARQLAVGAAVGGSAAEAESCGRSGPNAILPRPLVPSDVIPGFTYGRKVRPSTPIREVISYRFGEQAERELQRHQDAIGSRRAKERTEVRRIPSTSASRGHASNARRTATGPDEGPPNVFKISKFKNASPRVDTHRRMPKLEDDAPADMAFSQPWDHEVPAAAWGPCEHSAPSGAQECEQAASSPRSQGRRSARMSRPRTPGMPQTPAGSNTASQALQSAEDMLAERLLAK